MHIAELAYTVWIEYKKKKGSVLEIHPDMTLVNVIGLELFLKPALFPLSNKANSDIFVKSTIKLNILS